MRYNLDWVKEKFDNGELLKYIFFWGHTQKNDQLGSFVLSQWYPARFVFEGIEYKTAEHWMMAQKARLFNDETIFQKVITTDKPGEVKDLGRRIENFDEAKWNEAKYEIVKQGNLQKFQQLSNLKAYLLNTGERIIVEASPVDSIWGIGLSQDSKMIENPHNWKGENLLGFALMEVRDQLNKV